MKFLSSRLILVHNKYIAVLDLFALLIRDAVAVVFLFGERTSVEWNLIRRFYQFLNGLWLSGAQLVGCPIATQATGFENLSSHLLSRRKICIPFSVALFHHSHLDRKITAAWHRPFMLSFTTTCWTDVITSSTLLQNFRSPLQRQAPTSCLRNYTFDECACQAQYLIFFNVYLDVVVLYARNYWKY